MAEEDAFLVDNVEGGLCIDYTDAEIVIRCNNESDKDKGKDSLESKYMADDSFSKKFLVSNFNNYKMVDSRPVMEQYNELLRILGQYTQHGLKMDESISVSCIIDKLPSFRKDFKRTLKHGKDDLSLVQLNSHLRIEESLRVHDNDKGKGKEVNGPSVNMTEEGFGYYNNGMFMVNLNKVLDDSDSIYMSSSTVVNSLLWHARLGHVHYKRMLEMSKDDLITAIDENLEKCCKWIFKRKMKVDGTIDKIKARLEIQDFKQNEGIDYFDTYAPVACITTIRLLLALTDIQNLVIHQIDVKTTFLNGDLDEKVYMKQPEGFVMLGNEHKFYMEYELLAIGSANKEAEWLRNLIHEILIWPKPITPISINCDSAATLAKAYSQMYNGKSRHLGVRHSMIRELIMNDVISIEFVWSRQNLADHLTKGLARDLVNKLVIGIGLKFI
ncbi:zinc finger, CCHC-type containing protein [Tanacetum coccineum]